MNHHLLDTIFKKISSVRAAVIGDFCLDAYYFLDDEEGEPSVETGLPVRLIKSFRYDPGGAGNVARNLAALGVRSVHAFGLAGDDIFGHELVRLLNASGVRTDHMVFPPGGWLTNVYTKIYRSGREEPRFDTENLKALQEESALRVLARLEETCASFDVLVVNQQLKNGLHTPGFREGLRRFLQKQDSLPVLMDCRDYNDFYDNTLRKLNEYEGFRILGDASVSPGCRLSLEEGRRTASGLSLRWKKPVFLTRGERGCLVAEGEEVKQIRGIHTASRIDPVGAGDTMLAGIAAVAGASGGLEEAAEFGNIAASITVKKLFQTGTASPEEIRRAGADPDYIYNQEKLDSGKREYTAGGAIEVIGLRRPGVSLSYALFDHDGTLSVLREGWEHIMKPMMVRAVCGDTPAPPAVEEEIDGFISKTTGIQTIEQMHGLAEIVARSGYVPRDRVLSPAEYKEVYNRELVRMVEDRKQRIRDGELEPGDFIMKGAVEFLAELDRRGLRLYLASGSDQEDVRREAEFLGYASFFHGRIFGSVGNPEEDPKRGVIRDILAAIGPSGGQGIAVFGDGPVEIRETRKRGGFCVGILSDEVRRYGANEAKRPRLVRAGADILVPDFTVRRELLSILFPEAGADV